jgi:hypothetical protein
MLRFASFMKRSLVSSMLAYWTEFCSLPTEACDSCVRLVTSMPSILATKLCFINEAKRSIATPAGTSWANTKR